jgi:hypothetical protein
MNRLAALGPLPESVRLHRVGQYLAIAQGTG